MSKGGLMEMKVADTGIVTGKPCLDEHGEDLSGKCPANVGYVAEAE